MRLRERRQFKQFLERNPDAFRPKIANSPVGPRMAGSLLVDIFQPQHLKELCSLLVCVSAEAAKKISEQMHMSNKEDDTEQVETSIASSAEKIKDIYNRDDAQHLGTSQVDRNMTYACQSGVDHRQTGRALSPERLALLWDGRDAVTTGADSPTGVLSLQRDTIIKPSCKYVFNRIYAEQERQS